jgi:hypothetical protein
MSDYRDRLDDVGIVAIAPGVKTELGTVGRVWGLSLDSKNIGTIRFAIALEGRDAGKPVWQYRRPEAGWWAQANSRKDAIDSLVWNAIHNQGAS